jgi:signal transduction histidine kinase
MKDVGNKSTYFFKPTSLRVIVEGSISKYRKVIEEKKFNFRIGTFNDIPLLTADLKKLSFVFDVIVENALYYTPAGGSITLDAKLENNKVTFYAVDSGIGLSFMERMRIFSRFYRADRARLMYTDGMGLGLYLAKKIVKSHGGKIYAKSRGINKGATFFVELPR